MSRGCFSNLWHSCRTKEPNRHPTSDYSELTLPNRGDEALSYEQFTESASVVSSGCQECGFPYPSAEAITLNPLFTRSNISSISCNSSVPLTKMSEEADKAEKLEPEKPGETGVEVSNADGESKEVVKSTAADESGFPGMESLAATKYTHDQINKEHKKLYKVDKNISTQAKKLTKNRQSIESADIPEKKREKTLKLIGKGAEAIAVLEIEREAHALKIEKLNQIVSDRTSLACVVRRNTTLGKAECTQIQVVNT